MLYVYVLGPSDLWNVRRAIRSRVPAEATILDALFTAARVLVGRHCVSGR